MTGTHGSGTHAPWEMQPRGESHDMVPLRTLGKTPSLVAYAENCQTPILRPLSTFQRKQLPVDDVGLGQHAE
jgi:hypothetical protein